MVAVGRRLVLRRLLAAYGLVCVGGRSFAFVPVAVNGGCFFVHLPGSSDFSSSAGNTPLAVCGRPSAAVLVVLDFRPA